MIFLNLVFKDLEMDIRSEMHYFLSELERKTGGKFALILCSLDNKNQDITVRHSPKRILLDTNRHRQMRFGEYASRNADTLDREYDDDILDRELNDIIEEENNKGYDSDEIEYPGDSLPWHLLPEQVNFLTDAEKKELLDQELDEISRQSQQETKIFTLAMNGTPASYSDMVGNHYSYDIYHVITETEMEWMERQRKLFLQNFDCDDIIILKLSDTLCKDILKLLDDKEKIVLDEWYTFVLKVKGKEEYLTDSFHDWGYYYTPMCEKCQTRVVLCHCDVCENPYTQGYEHLCKCKSDHELN